MATQVAFFHELNMKIEKSGLPLVPEPLASKSNALYISRGQVDFTEKMKEFFVNLHYYTPCPSYFMLVQTKNLAQFNLLYPPAIKMPYLF